MMSMIFYKQNAKIFHKIGLYKLVEISLLELIQIEPLKVKRTQVQVVAETMKHIYVMVLQRWDDLDLHIHMQISEIVYEVWV
jgi:uncharacterized protein YlxP (DUF503 family)